MNIGNSYRKFLEKSRSLWALLKKSPEIDICLLIAVISAFTVAAIGRGLGKHERYRQTEIRISTQCEYFFGKEFTSALIQEFERQNPDLRILTVDGDGADIVFFDDSGFAIPAADGAETGGTAANLISLSPYIHNETGTEQRYVPLVLFIDLFFYNIDILTKANYVRPPGTRAEFLTAARAVALNGIAGGGTGASPVSTVYGMALGLNREDPSALRREIYPWVWGDGEEVSVVDADGKAALSKPSANIITFFGQLQRERLLAPGIFEKTGEQRLQEFAEGKVAMMTASARDIPFLRRNAPDVNFGVTAIPSATFGKNRIGLSGIYAGISGSCTLQDEAWAFLAFVAGKRLVLSELLGAVPGVFPDIIPGEYIVTDPLYSKAWEIFEAAEIIEYPPDRPGEEEIDRLVWERLREVL